MTVAAIIAATKAALPEVVLDELADVKICVLPLPTPELIEDGVDPAEAGAYIVQGEPPFFDGDDEPDRTIYLFLENMRPKKADTVRKVLLHEIGHACGLDEDEVSALGLDA